MRGADHGLLASLIEQSIAAEHQWPGSEPGPHRPWWHRNSSPVHLKMAQRAGFQGVEGFTAGSNAATRRFFQGETDALFSGQFYAGVLHTTPEQTPNRYFVYS